MCCITYYDVDIEKVEATKCLGVVITRNCNATEISDTVRLNTDVLMSNAYNNDKSNNLMCKRMPLYSALRTDQYNGVLRSEFLVIKANTEHQHTKRDRPG